uniref:Innexin n=1 Tax=Plectus sambesii TaxID=2011161 RepID=A0A914VZ00_9BILA
MVLMLDKLSKVLKRLKRHNDDDLFDQINYYYTSMLLLIFALLVSAKQYVGAPLQCWLPAFFTHSMEQYAEDYCWVKNTWFLNVHQQIPEHHANRSDAEIVYYQWTPFILFIQSVVCFLPCLFWLTVNKTGAFDLERIIKFARDTKNSSDANERQRLMKTVGYFIEDGLAQFRGRASLQTTLKSWRLPALYMLHKIFYCFNALFQIYLASHLLGIHDVYFGWSLFKRLSEGSNWETSGIFPRVTMCDFEVKMMGNVHRHTIQCVLVINMFNEKIFLFLWFWFASLFLASFVNFFYWVSLLACGNQRRFIKKHLRRRRGRDPCLPRKAIEEFAEQYLHADGVFLLRLLEKRAGSLIASLVIDALFNEFNDFQTNSIDENIRKGLQQQQNLSFPELIGLGKPIIVSFPDSDRRRDSGTTSLKVAPAPLPVDKFDQEHTSAV